MFSKPISKLILSLLIPQLAGLIGTLFTTPSIPTWYAALIKPALNPPNWIFGPVWTTLFLLMGIALFLIWSAYEKAAANQATKKRLQTAICLFAVQLVLNILWSGLFFGLHNPGAAFIEIIFLWLAILATIIAFYQATPANKTKLAAYLLIPYLPWVTFAAYLNLSIWLLN